MLVLVCVSLVSYWSTQKNSCFPIIIGHFIGFVSVGNGDFQAVVSIPSLVRVTVLGK